MQVGILGNGQLGRMLALAGHSLGQQFHFLGRTQAGATRGLGRHALVDSANDAGLERFATGLDVLTFESESWEAEALRRASAHTSVHPSPRALESSQDRLAQKELCARVGVPSAPFERVDGVGSLDRALARLGLPAVLKLRRGGYDGKGQWQLREEADCVRARAELGTRLALLESWIPFERELALIAVRGRDGERAFYPLVENHHEKGCLRLTLAPAPRADALQREAEALATALLEELDYVGVLALEWFQVDGHLVLNELAPRVHNSGHWTIEGAETSQFENHLRAIAGLPLGSTRALGAAAMLNLLGTLPPAAAILGIPGAHLHLYGKDPAPGRKLGHVTLRASSEGSLARNLETLCSRLSIPLPPAALRWMRSSSSGSI